MLIREVERSGRIYIRVRAGTVSDERVLNYVTKRGRKVYKNGELWWELTWAKWNHRPMGPIPPQGRKKNWANLDKKKGTTDG